MKTTSRFLHSACYIFILLIATTVISCKEGAFKQLDDSYIHNAGLPMLLERFAPAVGSEATEVIIYGDNYSTDPKSVTVKVNGIDATVIGSNRKRILVKIPKGAGTGNIEVTIGGQSIQSKEAFEYVPSRTVSTLAGSGVAGYADGKGAAAQFNFITNAGMDTDSDGNLYVADINNHCIRKITPDGTVTTLAGKPGVAGNVNGQGTAALFDHPTGLVVDKDNNVLVTDTWNWALRKITPGGTVSTVLGWVLPFPQGMTIDDKTGKMYLVSALPAVTQGKIYEVSPAGVMTEHQLDVKIIAGGIAIDSKGNLVIADNGSSAIYQVNTANWTTTLIAGAAGEQGWVDGAGEVARFDHPWGVAIDAADNIYVAGCGHLFDAPTISATASNIRMIAANTGKVTTIAGGDVQGYADGLGGVARFSVPTGIAVGKDGILYVLDKANHRIRKIISE
ncbi:IPT/TIG domain-containing protein [Chitinophaga defluvii]|uniref:IPT/TIG domain-containing protein n=1 Tax=Chitinophaga defluvii TaxID=3163343 RepID=A0ABV2T0A3_9BACT